MRRGILSIILFASLIAVLLLWGCGGGGPGSPGSTGCEDYGLICEATIEPIYRGTPTPDVDAIQFCPDGSLEPFEAHVANITINLRLINPNASITPPPLYIEGYTIEYRRLDDSIGAPPIEQYSDYITASITPPTGTGINTYTFPGMFVDLIRKRQYADDMRSGRFSSSENFINHYTAIYTIHGKIMGDKVTIQGTHSFYIGDYNNCQ
jgi:hypothetical protein